MGRKGAAARFRELGSELRKCREQAGLSGQVVAERTGWDKSKISRVESGHQQLTDGT
ncbi:MAG: helix-turn-helix domain-containing protein [Actinophytocola sp.]|uniref:helix-turn-helix domain-containing protein n=1 Tax=Actinophytocola sp. TaxID=1872138 RepID=UPI00132B2FEB|nr:helix-turn-helix transcriptional regulator [Actinophytocola sp.]MPZ79396.1 helix-turn-helix domain-containing protein [Actinophytocola sp.]